MLSRVADNLYWFGRYLQRAEGTARLINVNANLLLDLPKSMTPGWEPLIQIVGADTDYRELYGDTSEASVVRFLTVDARYGGSIRSSLTRAREILRTARDTMPQETWERLNDVYFLVEERSEAAIIGPQRQQFLIDTINGVLQVSSILQTCMSRDVGFRFLSIGSNIEQADMTTRILDVRSASWATGDAAAGRTPFENIVWMSVLRSLTAYQMYRRHARSRVSGPGVLRFLLQNREFPRSVLYCLSEIADALPHLPSNRKIERAIERTRALVRDANIDALLRHGGDLSQLMDEIQIGLISLHEALAENYLPAA